MQVALEKTVKSSNDWIAWVTQGEVSPHFQPIVSMENKLVFGYEILGRIKFGDGSIHTLGEFFQSNKESQNDNSDIHFVSYRQKIDNQILKKALKIFKAYSDPDTNLFINLSPMRIWNYCKNIKAGKTIDMPPLMKEIIQAQIDPERIVIEITEDSIQNLDLLKPIIGIYKGFGFKIAIDDLGSKSSNLDRITILRPDIIKIDMQYLKKSITDRRYEEILSTLSHLGERLGISLLFEGVETTTEFHQALKYGSRYVQGYLFDKAISFPLNNKGKYISQLDSLIKYFYIKKENEISNEIIKQQETEELIRRIKNQLKFSENNILCCKEVFYKNKIFFRIFVTDPFGNLVSQVYKRPKDKEIEIQKTDPNTNFTWRPFFIKSVYQLKKNKNDWVISSPYCDLEDNSIIKTIAMTIDLGLILFIDILCDDGF